MAKRISQETFDAVVKENMEDFEMEEVEAIEDAVKQFESQGVNLANIVRDLFTRQTEGGVDKSVHRAIDTVKNISSELEKDVPDKDILSSEMKKLKSECDIDLPHRCLAGSNGAYDALYKMAEKYQTEKMMLLECLQTICSLCNGQPDLLDHPGISLMMQLLEKNTEDIECTMLIVRFIRYCCVMHESNRQAFVKEKLIEVLMNCMREHKSSGDMVKEVCIVLRVLTFDDDVRVPFGQGHEHAKKIVTESAALRTIIEISQDYVSNTSVLGELFSTLGKLSVRDEFCQEIMDLGGLALILKSMEANIAHQSIVKQLLGVIKAVAGNDNVKVAIVKENGMELILGAMSKHMSQALVCELACAAIACIILRQPTHCQRVIDVNGAAVIVQAMNVHKNSSGVQHQACMAMRNLVVRSREYCDQILALGAEELINEARKKYPICDDTAKAALRDLGCKVELQERWKGERPAMHYD